MQLMKPLCMVCLAGLIATASPALTRADGTAQEIPDALAPVSIHRGYGAKLRGHFDPQTGIVRLPVVVTDGGVADVELKLVDRAALILEEHSITSLDPAVLPGLTSAPAGIDGSGTLTVPEVDVNGVLYRVALSRSTAAAKPRFTVTSMALAAPELADDSAFLALEGYFLDPGIGRII